MNRRGRDCGNAVVGGVEHLGDAVVAGLVDFPQQPFVGWPARLVVVGQRVHVLQDEPAGPGFAQDARVGLEQGGVRVEALALPVKPEPGLGERRAGRAAYQQVRAFPGAEPGSCEDLVRRECQGCSSAGPVSADG